VQVEPARDLGAAVVGPAEKGEPGAQPGFGPVIQEGAVKVLQALDRQLLRRVGLQQPQSAQLAIGRHRFLRRGCRTVVGNHQGVRYCGRKGAELLQPVRFSSLIVKGER